MEIVIPVAKPDIKKLINNLPFLRKQLSEFDEIVVITNKENFNMFSDDVRLIDEDTLYDGMNYNYIKELIVKRGGESKRTGWYLQQFLKMAYSLISSEYYLIWDSDTLPLRKIQMFSNGKCVFDLKDEKHQPYFDTIKELLGIDRIIEKSFISEHMLIKKEFMLELIHFIEANNSISGTLFFEKIINSININDLSLSGFSEFETYGTYVMANHKDSYCYRELKTIRHGKMFFGDIISDSTYNWLSKNFDTISNEKYDKIMKCSKVLNSKFIHLFNSKKVLSFICKIKKCSLN